MDLKPQLAADPFNGLASVGGADLCQLWEPVSGVNTHDALSDSVWKFVGPLVNGLVGNTHGLGRSRHGPAEKFYGLRLFHAAI